MIVHSKDKKLKLIYDTARKRPRKIRYLRFLLSCLASNDEDERYSAALALGVYRDRRSVFALIKATSDPTLSVRVCAINSLGHLAHKSSFKLLSMLLKDETVEIASESADALCCYGNIAIRPLCKALKDRPHPTVKYSIVHSLGELKAKRCLFDLEAVVLEDTAETPYGKVSEAAMAAIEKIKAKG